VAVTLRIIKGDATSPQATGPKIIAHICNDVGSWGRGFVLAVSRRWPEAELDYREWHRHRAENDFALGAVRMVPVEPDIWVANMVGQRGIMRGIAGPPIRYPAVEKCLNALGDHALNHDASVHMPRIGCGLAGGRWEKIEPIIVTALCQRHVPVATYDLD
jgi:O-acetyl-ADP-ribose deacetylase (regulator of RNase III)